jgi:hypothetical protein
MRIQNYDATRAENNRIINDKKVNSYNKFEKNAFCIRSILLIIINVCLFAMSSITLFAIVFIKDSMNSPYIWPMVAITGVGLIISCGFLVTRKKPTYLSDTHFDDAETQYHRLSTNYNILDMIVKDDHVTCLCEKDKCVRSFYIHPKLIKTSNKIKTPVLDVQYSCLWLPA